MYTRVQFFRLGSSTARQQQPLFNIVPFPPGFWKANSAWCSSPLLVLVNSKSGDNQGVKFLRKFKQLLNPAQVFDLMNGGPQLGYATAPL